MLYSAQYLLNNNNNYDNDNDDIDDDEDKLSFVSHAYNPSIQEDYNEW